uniref:Uncharacterized protein n=1 Tax=Anguilla anguilla TaxID=7936 RepID=A0A0E9S543_ANGAN
MEIHIHVRSNFDSIKVSLCGGGSTSTDLNALVCSKAFQFRSICSPWGKKCKHRALLW